MITAEALIQGGVNPRYAESLAAKINSLSPLVQDRFAQTVMDFYGKYGDQGYDIDINQAARTPAEQMRIRSTGVKAASPRNTWHTVGGAADFTIFRNGVADDGTSGANPYVKLLAPIAANAGLVNPIRNDVGHFQPREVPPSRGGAGLATFIPASTGTQAIAQNFGFRDPLVNVMGYLPSVSPVSSGSSDPDQSTFDSLKVRPSRVAQRTMDLIGAGSTPSAPTSAPEASPYTWGSGTAPDTSWFSAGKPPVPVTDQLAYMRALSGLGLPTVRPVRPSGGPPASVVADTPLPPAREAPAARRGLLSIFQPPPAPSNPSYGVRGGSGAGPTYVGSSPTSSGGPNYDYRISDDGKTVSWTNSKGHTFTVPRSV